LFWKETSSVPKSWSEYSLGDWLRIRPLVTRYKHARFLARYFIITRKPALSGDVESIVSAASDGRVLTTITFNAPAKAFLQIRAIKRFVPDSLHIIADNSNDDALAEQIRKIAHDEGICYVRLPRGPWTGADGGLSHGLGMTWVWRNIIRKARPRAFGFIDHDIYPTATTDPFAPLAQYPVAGRVWVRPPRWHLWAGFCFFRFDAVAALKLNFIRDFFAGLDTGGGNWHPLYRKLNHQKVPDPGIRFEPILQGVSIEECRVEWLGVWLHEHNDWRALDGYQERDLMKEKFVVVSDRLAAILAKA
jgi:hypothetical protein